MSAQAAPRARDRCGASNCARYEAHDGDHEEGCSECWRGLHPEAVVPVDAERPWCPVRHRPCVREREHATGLRVVVRGVVVDGRTTPWFVGVFIREVDDALLVAHPTAERMIVDPRRVASARRGRD